MLMKRLIYTLLLLGSATTGVWAKPFKDSSELTTSKAFYDLRQDYKTWLSPDASLEAQYETVMASMQDQEALIKAKQEEIAVADSTQLAALYVELGILTSDYKDLKVLLEQVKLSLETLRTQTAEDIKGNNATINTAALYESNQKIVNDIYYSTIAKGYGEFRPAQVALLANIANQCPFAGGPAVYQARSLYAAVVDTLYDDKAICQQVNIAYRPTSTTLTESASQAFKVFPNPAQTDLTVLADNALTEDTQLSLINTLGQVELSVWLNKGTTQKTISLAAIPNGLYICKIGQSVSYKLIVMKP